MSKLGLYDRKLGIHVFARLWCTFCTLGLRRPYLDRLENTLSLISAYILHESSRDQSMMPYTLSNRIVYMISESGWFLRDTTWSTMNRMTVWNSIT